MKFYYNGKLVRTSKNHIYTHAVIDIKTGEIVGCRANKQTAESIITSEMARIAQGKKNSEAGIKALNAGKSMYRIKEGNRSCWMPIEKSDTVETFTNWMAWLDSRAEYITANWQVIELEAREK